MTDYDRRMTMLSFRVDDEDAHDISTWADRLAVDRSELLRRALRRELERLRAEDEVAAYDAAPVTDAERSVADVADWGPAEDWSDWADAPR